jgi:solute carrier family 45 protein 3
MWVVSFAVILLDYASQAAINPCESLVADILKSASNANTGFMIYSAMLSLGSCVGYLLSALDWSTLAQITGNSEQVRFLYFLKLLVFNL